MGEHSKLETKFIMQLKELYMNMYIENRKNGLSRETAFYQTKDDMQSHVLHLIIHNSEYAHIIAKAFKVIDKTQDSLVKVANVRYDLSFCNEEIKQKYMPLTTI